MHPQILAFYAHRAGSTCCMNYTIVLLRLPVNDDFFMYSIWSNSIMIFVYRLAPWCSNMACIALALHGANGLLYPLCLCNYLLGDDSTRFRCIDDAPYPYTGSAHVFLHCEVRWMYTIPMLPNELFDSPAKLMFSAFIIWQRMFVWHTILAAMPVIGC